jgi:3-deoxy-7-phosphoheptulonate synthase
MGPHHFLGVTEDGLPAVFSTTGNAYPHVVLRGGKTPNYDAESVAACVDALRDAHLPQNVIVDCSHGNSGKKADRQGLVLRDVLSQIEAGQTALRGFMIESNLEAGHQPMPANPALLNPRVSITDECIDWPTTEELLKEAHARMSQLMRQESEVRSQKSE